MSKTISEKMQAHTVMVAGGSGVLIQPMTDEYTYVFTAKHNLRDDKDNANSRFKAISEILIVDIEGKHLKILEIIRDVDVDIAIIIIDFYSNCTIPKYTNKVELMEKVWLYGYPETRRNTDDKISQYQLELQRITNNELVFSNNDIASSEEINGFSGGGFFYLNQSDDEAFLCGIETSMDGNDREYHGRIKGVPVSKFEELIKKSECQGKVLAPILPIHLKSFLYLNSIIFELTNCHSDANLEEVKLYLRDIATNISSTKNLTPLSILNKYKDCLKVRNRDENELLDERMWGAFLELLVLSLVVDEPENISEDYIKNIINSRRPVYVRSNDGWKKILQYVLCSEHKNLNDNAVIILVTFGEKPTEPCINPSINQNAVKDISKGKNKEDIAYINRTIKANNKIIHFSKSHDVCIADKEHEYQELTRIFHEETIKKKLKEDYSDYLNNTGNNNV